MTLDLPQGYWTKFTAEWLEEANISDAVREAAREQGIEWPEGKIEGATMRGLLMIAQGESYDVMNQPVEKEGRSLRKAKIVVQRRLRFEANQTIWWQDATGDVALLQRLLGSPVRDMTPHGQLERLQAVEVVPVDISRKTVIQKVANAIRMTVMTSGCQRLGIIGHKNHIDLLQSEEDQLLIPEIRARIHRFSYFGAGLDRGSNQWMECDRLLVLGTPRVGDDAIREELWRDGDRKAAQIRDPGWTKYTWQDRAAGYQDEVVTVVGRCYSVPAWHQAFLRVTRAAMRQALGRGRAILACGVPATIWTTEALSEYRVLADPVPHTAVIDAVQVLWIATVARPETQTRRGVKIDQRGVVWLSGAEIARRLELDPGTVSRVLKAAQEHGLAERSKSSRGGWSLRLAAMRQTQ